MNLKFLRICITDSSFVAKCCEQNDIGKIGEFAFK